jgi:hypothetical protein
MRTELTDLEDKGEKTPRKSKRDIVSEWREKNLEELDRNLSTWKSIRDDPDASDRDRIEAGKAIARQMGALAPDAAQKQPTGERVYPGGHEPKLKPAHAAELEAILNGL